MSEQINKLNKMVKEAQNILEMRKESLFEARVTAEFNPTPANKSYVKHCEERVAEKQNYISVLEKMLKSEEQTPAPKQIPENESSFFGFRYRA